MLKKQTKVVDVHIQFLRPEYHDLKKWMLDENNVYIGRRGIVFVYNEKSKERWPKQDSIWANPFKGKKGSSHQQLVDQYEDYIRQKLKEEPHLVDELKKLEGKKLGCWCKGNKSEEEKLCHGDVLVRLIDEYFHN